uniref:Sorting nexin 12 n=2 Tax=Passeriformes TaxID=9126 RepID=H0ZAA4_TAEGU
MSEAAVADTRRLNAKPQDLTDAYGPPSNFLEIDIFNPQTVGMGRARYTSYELRMRTNLPIFKLKESCVRRRYSDFEWLKNELERDSKIVVPPLPGKALKRQLPFRGDEGIFEESFIEERRQGLEQFINKIAGHPLAQNERCLHMFLQEETIDRNYVPGKVNLHVQYPGTRLKPTSPARSRLQFASGALKQAQPSGNPKLASQDREMKTAAKVGSHKQPSSRLSTGIPIMASRSSLQPSEKVIPSKRFCLNKGSTTQELVYNRNQELKENSESNERLVAASIVLGAGEQYGDINDQTWVCAKSSLSSELAPGLTSWCEDTVPAEQSAGDQLSKELERVKQELEQVKGELAEKTAQCKTYQQTISSLEAQLRAAGMIPAFIQESI